MVVKNIGIDVGGVLADLQHNGPISPDALQVIKQLQDSGLYKLYIVSQCNKQRQEQTKRWLEEMKVPIPLSQQYYINFKEPDKGKLAKKLKLNVLIDDSPRHGYVMLQLGIHWFHFSLKPLDPMPGRFYTFTPSWHEVSLMLLNQSKRF
jgi:hypothetical protein